MRRAVLSPPETAAAARRVPRGLRPLGMDDLLDDLQPFDPDAYSAAIFGDE